MITINKGPMRKNATLISYKRTEFNEFKQSQEKLACIFGAAWEQNFSLLTPSLHSLRVVNQLFKHCGRPQKCCQPLILADPLGASNVHSSRTKSPTRTTLAADIKSHDYEWKYQAPVGYADRWSTWWSSRPIRTLYLQMRIDPNCKYPPSNAFTT